MTPKSRMLTMLMSAVLWIALNQTAQAFYNPSTGRWLSRDPIGERGGKNLNAFVDNNPVATIDANGHHPAIIVVPVLLLLQGCSKDTCVCEGKTIKASPADTGVSTWRWQGQERDPVTSKYPYHEYLTWQTGEIENNYPHETYRINKKVRSTEALSPFAETKVKLSPCKFNFRKFSQCLQREADTYAQGQEVRKDCDKFDSELIEKCKEESGGCTASP